MSSWSQFRQKFSWLAPRTRVARFTAYLLAIELFLLALRWILDHVASGLTASLGGWTTFLGIVVCALIIFLALRWFRNHVMWSVRNRLIVTYLFVGVLPITLVLLIASLSTYYLAKQFAIYVAVSEINNQADRLLAANSMTAGWLARRGDSKPLPSQLPNSADPAFPGKTISLLSEADRPAWLKDGFHGLVLDQGKLFLRAATIVPVENKNITLVSSAPMDRNLLARVAASLGPMDLYVPERTPLGESKLEVSIASGSVTINGVPAKGTTAGSLAPPQNRWDYELSYSSFIQAFNWKTGAEEARIWFLGSVRVSSLYSRLSAYAANWADLVLLALIALAVTFAIIVIIAWLIGIRLTRTLTYSVANLYKATEHINRGDFKHRIQVRHKDQLGALQSAFNSMTESVERLLAEQKEKERLQSELEIAHEVQSQLFPQGISGTRTLEVFGVCRPARIVSGDYYDFLSYSPAQIGIAVGDIAGKGISAALLMATIHSAIRAYEQEQEVEAGVVSAYGGGSKRLTAVAPRITTPSPAEILWLLNRHLYRSTQPEKYATLFLGFYDDNSRRLTYSNAGHLPPIILGQDGSTRRLEVGGTVVGLFDQVEYDKESVELYPGDLFIAFSDGMTEPENEYGEFGEERLVETIAAYRDLPLERISEHAVAAVQDWIGSAEQPDDVTLVLARRIA